MYNIAHEQSLPLNLPPTMMYLIGDEKAFI